MNRIVHIIIYFLIVGIIIFNSPEYAYNLGIIPIRLEDSPFLIKISKDIGMILLALIGYSHILYRRKVHINQTYFIFFPLYIIICCLFTQETMLCIAGIRWILPFLLMGLLFPYIDEILLRKISIILFLLLILQFITQCIELFVMKPYNGTTVFGLTARVPGLFYVPNTSASFVLLTYYIIIVFTPNKVIKRITTLISFLSLLLMMSSTGTFIFIIILFLKKYYSSKYFKLLLLVSPFFLLIIFSNLDLLTGRSDGSTVESGSVRISILEYSLKNTALISNNFGEATNSAKSIGLDDSFIADSNIIAVYHNLGILGFIYITAISAYSVMYAHIKKKMNLLMFLIIFFLLNIPAVFFEVFPANLLSSIIIAFYLKKESERTSFHLIN